MSEPSTISRYKRLHRHSALVNDMENELPHLYLRIDRVASCYNQKEECRKGSVSLLGRLQAPCPAWAPGALATNMSPDANVNAAGAQPVAASTRASASAGATTNAVGAVYTPAQALRRAQGTRSASAASLPAASFSALIFQHSALPCSPLLHRCGRQKK